MKNFLKHTLIIALNMMVLCGNAQNYHIEGTVTDSLTRKSLAFVNITINNDGHLGTTTDIDGNFTINSRTAVNTLTFSYVGYFTKTIDVSKSDGKIRVKMKQDDIRLDEVVVFAGENPAHRIIDSVVANRKRNNPSSLPSYSYIAYERFVVRPDTLSLRVLKRQFINPDSTTSEEISNVSKLRKFVDTCDYFIMETVSEKLHKGSKDRKNILATYTSGMKEPFFLYMVDNFQSIDFYSDFISILNQKYVNPISSGSKSKYFFTLEDIIPVDDTIRRDSIYVISFHPKKNTNFSGMTGVMSIHSDGWAIFNVKAEPTEGNEPLDIDITIQQIYEKAEGKYWFPKQYNTDIIIGDIGVAGNDGYSNYYFEYNVSGMGRSSIHHLQINPDIDDAKFNNLSIDVQSDAHKKSDEFWSQYRPEDIAKRITSTEIRLDSIMNNAGITFDDAAHHLVSMADKGEISLSKVSLDLNKVLDYNIGNKFYLGAGFNTNRRFSKTIGLSVYGGYWFGAKEANFGAAFNARLNKEHDMRIKVAGDYKFQRFGSYGFDSNQSILNYKKFYIDATTLNKVVTAEYSTYLGRNFQGFATFGYGDWDTTRVSSLELKLRISFKEKFMNGTSGLKSLGTDYPIIWLSYEKGFSDVFESECSYDRLQLQVSDDWDIKYFGKTSVMLQAGYLIDDAPDFKHFNIFGSMARFGVYSEGTFATMEPDEFLCTEFAALFFKHNFGQLLFKTEHFRPEFSIVTNICFGNPSLDKGFYESGLLIDNILSSPITKVGFGVIYRYGPYSREKSIDNFGFKVSAAFTL